MTAALEFLGTTKLYGKFLALNSLELSLEPGQILGFIGPNGAGKTTALHLALGFLRPSSGSGRLLGRPFGDTAARRCLGFLPDVPVFFAGSAKSALELAGRLNGLRAPHLRARALDLLARLGLEGEQKEARRFSRGMQQRLGLAQALVNDPELLILDEPTSALDPAGVLVVRDLLREARAAGKSVFFSSHQLSEVEQICDRVAFLNDGRLIRQGSLDELTRDRDLVAIVARGMNGRPLPMAGVAAAAERGQETQWLVPASRARAVIEAVWLAGGELVSVQPRRRSLEELFVAWSAEGNGERQAR